MEKFRKMFYHIKNILQCPDIHVIIILGLRKTGKTTILKQLETEMNGQYINFRDEPNETAEDTYLSIFDDSEKKYVFLDEICYLNGYDVKLNNIERDIASCGKTIVMTSTSYATLKELASGRLGGRCHIVELFPIDFEEYLYFSNKIYNYGENYEPTVKDLQDFYRMRDLPDGMNFIIDRIYMEAVFHDNEASLSNNMYADRTIHLKPEQYAAVIDVLSYTMNNHFSLKQFDAGNVGYQEYSGKEIRKNKLTFTDSLIYKAKETTNEMQMREIAIILAYLIQNGFLFVDLYITNTSKQDTGSIIRGLLGVQGEEDLTAILTKYTLSPISPLLYTRLMIDMEFVAEHLITQMNGDLYELTVKSENVYSRNFCSVHYSYKFTSDDGTNQDVDIVETKPQPLLLECSVGNKQTHHLKLVYPEHDWIRVLTDKPDTWDLREYYYRIGYPKALLMLSNRSIFNLTRTRATLFQSQSINEDKIIRNKLNISEKFATEPKWVPLTFASDKDKFITAFQMLEWSNSWDYIEEITDLTEELYLNMKQQYLALF